MCQAVVVSVALGADEYVGFCAGYLGGGEFLSEPFHVQFQGEEAVHLVIGERSVLTRKEVLFDRWSAQARAGVVAARARLRTLMRSDDEGFFVATPAEVQKIRWSATQADEGLSEGGKIDARVWLRIPAQMGLSSCPSDE
jgi:hypothetical protein